MSEIYGEIKGQYEAMRQTKVYLDTQEQDMKPVLG